MMHNKASVVSKTDQFENRSAQTNFVPGAHFRVIFLHSTMRVTHVFHLLIQAAQIGHPVPSPYF